MKLPYLKFWDNTPITVSMTSGMDENGEEKVVGVFSGLCNYNQKNTTRLDADGQLVTLNGTVYMEGDIFPDLPYITGKVVVDGNEWNIYTASRPANPDGTIHHTKIELI